MGTRGPVPKRDDERKRTNERPMETTRAVGAAEVKQPRGDGDWHPIVKKLWKAMGESGQSQFYEPSDWAIAYSTMDDLSDYKRQARRSPAMLQVIMSSLSNLLVTEGDRRRVQIELSRPGEVTAAQDKTIKMDEWRRKLS